MIGWPEKDPDANLDYTIDWEPTLEIHPNDVIIDSVWEHSPIGITVESVSFDDFTATIWLSGGAEKQLYQFTNTITTAQGRIFVAKFKIRVRDQVCVVVNI